MLVLQLEAVYEGNDGAYTQGKTYPILAITKSDVLETASQCSKELMQSNNWCDFNFSRYGAIKDSSDAPKSFGEPSEWQKSLEEFGAIYIVYTD